MTSGNPIRATGASEAHLGVSPRDCGATVPRSAYGGAALSQKEIVASRAEARRLRDAVVCQSYEDGAPVIRLAEAFGLSCGGIWTILRKQKGFVAHRQRPGFAQARERRIDQYFAEYQEGFTTREIGERHGLSGPRVLDFLREHPDYRPRQHAFVGRNRGAFDTPAWVPPQHQARFQNLASSFGEEIAASCIRRLKAREARSQ